jgi:flagellar biosynthesis/type III secretory pathway protein FliH
MAGEAAMSWTWEELAPGSVAGRSDLPSAETLEAERNQELERAYERGFTEGVSAGRKRAMEDLQPNLQAAVNVAAELEDFRATIAARMQDDLSALALAVGRLLMEREVRSEPEVVANLVRSALSQFPLDQKLRIRLNPLDLSSISRERSASQPPLSAGREVRWIPDETVARGGCVVEGPERIVDGRVATALERIYRAMSNG